MKISKEKLQQEAANTGFKMEHLEKVYMLMDLLEDIASFPQFKDKFVLKGGTALNLFFFNLPRLSVDIDLNYIGAVERDTMLSEKPMLQKNVSAICERHGLRLERNPSRHAGGKMVWRYPSALGQMGNLEVDLNFMYRIPLWPVQFKSSCIVGTKQKAFQYFFPLTKNEHDFLEQLLSQGVIRPELLSDDMFFIENVKNHPAIKWAAQQSKV